MAELATLARPYARAAFGVAQDSGAVEAMGQGLALLGAAAAAPEVAALLAAPKPDPAAKAAELAGFLPEGAPDALRALLAVLAENKRLALLPEIATQFAVARDALEQTLDVEVVLAQPADEATLERLKAALQARFKKEIAISHRIDPTLLGGALIRAGDTLIDGSVRGRLGRLADALRV
jgi:F-type H+-transporting ATPase subunit delta